jgi:hypothetical protein
MKKRKNHLLHLLLIQKKVIPNHNQAVKNQIMIHIKKKKIVLVVIIIKKMKKILIKK